MRALVVLNYVLWVSAFIYLSFVWKPLIHGKECNCRD